MYKKAHASLYRWYQKNGRHDLPWRQTDDAYPIWISEIMLQQTQVKTVLERFYFPFLDSFPTLSDLAKASEDEVLKQWEGLGYYTRARNLHKSAQLCQDKLPQSVKELIALPGIGQSTAHAIAAFAYKTPVPIMDANVKRILYRVFAITKASEKELWKIAYRFFDKDRPYDFNQAMMDLGSTVCTGKAALCEACPFIKVCQAVDNPLAYPEKKTKKPIPVRKKHIVIHTFEKKFALKQRSTRFLNGLWGFSEYDSQEEISVCRTLGDISHTYSHFKLEARVHLHNSYIEEHEWFSLDEIEKLALSTADHKALALLSKA
jgi:A/G-specific adenine glycosylase